MGIRRLGLILLAYVFCTGGYVMPIVPVVFQLDSQPDKMFYQKLAVPHGTFICTVYPMHSRSNPVRLGCLRRDPKTKEVIRSIQPYPHKVPV